MALHPLVYRSTRAWWRQLADAIATAYVNCYLRRRERPDQVYRIEDLDAIQREEAA